MKLNVDRPGSKPYMFVKSIKYQSKILMVHRAKPEWRKVEKLFFLAGNVMLK